MSLATARIEAVRRARAANWLAIYWRRYCPARARVWRDRRDDHMWSARDAGYEGGAA